MIRLAIASLLLAACSAAGADGSPAFTVATPEVWVDASSPLYEAQGAWGLPLPFEPALVFDYGTAAEVAEACGMASDRLALACTQHGPQRIIFATGIPEASRLLVFEHELGHIIRGRSGHIEGDDCPDAAPGEHVMCAFGRADPTITYEDLNFVLGLEE